MTTFDKRKDGFENLFAHDEEVRFRAFARRNKLLGLWAAEKMGLTGDAASEYAMALVVEDLKEVGEDDVFAKVRTDLADKGAGQSDHQIRRTMDELLAVAVEQIRAEG